MATPTLKLVKVKRGIFTNMTKPADVQGFIVTCVSAGTASTIYRNPKIPTAYYTAGTDASDAIIAAKATYDDSKTDANKGLWFDRMADGVTWLEGYADKVEPIANDDANRTTREQAFHNIELSNLTPQKLASQKKGIPEVVTFTAANVGTGKVKIEVTNGISFKPNQVTFIAVEAAVMPTVSLDATGTLSVSFGAVGSVNIFTSTGKNLSTILTALKPGVDYLIYAYAQNGKKQIGLLSDAVRAKG